MKNFIVYFCSISLLFVGCFDLSAQKDDPIALLNQLFKNKLDLTSKSVQKMNAPQFSNHILKNKSIPEKYRKEVEAAFDPNGEENLYLVLNSPKCDGGGIYMEFVAKKVTKPIGRFKTELIEIVIMIYVYYDSKSPCAQLLRDLGFYVFEDSDGKRKELCSHFGCLNDLACVKFFGVAPEGFCAKNTCHPRNEDSCTNEHAHTIYTGMKN